MKIVDAESLGKAIRRRRKELHYTQAYLAEYTGFSASFISDLERGKETAEIGKTIFFDSDPRYGFMLGEERIIF